MLDTGSCWFNLVKLSFVFFGAVELNTSDNFIFKDLHTTICVVKCSGATLLQFSIKMIFEMSK